MPASLSATASAGKLSVTGAGHAPNVRVLLLVAYSKTTAPKRAYVETVEVTTDANGAISVQVPAPFPGGNVTVKSADPFNAVLATATSVAV
jgi:hypothetical protein